MNTRSACIALLSFSGASLLISSVLSCSKHKGGWSSDSEYKVDYSHLDNLDASIHPTLSEKIKEVVKDHYHKGKGYKHGHGYSGHVSSGGYGFGAGGHHHGGHEGVAWSPPNPIVIQHGTISHGYNRHHQNHHQQENYHHQNHNQHNDDEDDEGHNEIDYTNEHASNNNHVFSQGAPHRNRNSPPVQENKNWPLAHSYQYAAHNSELVPLAVRPSSGIGSSSDFKLKDGDGLGIPFRELQQLLFAA